MWFGKDVAGLTGFEPATFRVTGGHSKPLSYSPSEIQIIAKFQSKDNGFKTSFLVNIYV